MIPHDGSQSFFSQVNPVLVLKIRVLMEEEPKYFCDDDCIVEGNNFAIHHAEVIFEGYFIDVAKCVPHFHSSHQFFQIPELPPHFEIHLQFPKEFPLQFYTITVHLLNFPLLLSHLQLFLQQLRFSLQYLSIDFQNTLQAFLRGVLDQQRGRVITCIRIIFIFLFWKLIVFLKESKVLLTRGQISPKPLKVVHFEEVAMFTHILFVGVHLQAAHHALLIANLAYLHLLSISTQLMHKQMINRLMIARPRGTRPLLTIFFTVFSEKTSLFTANTNIIEPSGTLAHHQVYLQQRYHRTLKKPLPKLVQEEDTLITAYLSQGKLNQVCDFLIRNKTYQLSSVLTVPAVNNHLHMQWQTLSPSEKIKFSWALLHFGDYRAYLRLKEEFILKIDPTLPISRSIPLLTQQELNIYLYAEIVIQRGVTSLNGLRSPRLSRGELSAILAHYNETNIVDIHGYEDRGDQINSMLQYFEVLAQGKVSQVIRQNPDQQPHSVLEKDIDCYLEVLNYNKFRQVQISGHHVDFVIHPNAQPQQRTILEVLGGYHYTIDGKLKPSDIIKGLKLNQFARLRFVHFQDLNETKGNRNKLAYIQNILMSPIINWDPTGKYDSHWQLDDYYHEFQ